MLARGNENFRILYFVFSCCPFLLSTSNLPRLVSISIYQISESKLSRVLIGSHDSCNNPAPAYGGAPCKGDANNIEVCLVRYCPGKTNFHYWCVNI